MFAANEDRQRATRIGRQLVDLVLLMANGSASPCR